MFDIITPHTMYLGLQMNQTVHEQLELGSFKTCLSLGSLVDEHARTPIPSLFTKWAESNKTKARLVSWIFYVLYINILFHMHILHYIKYIYYACIANILFYW